MLDNSCDIGTTTGKEEISRTRNIEILWKEMIEALGGQQCVKMTAALS